MRDLENVLRAAEEKHYSGVRRITKRRLIDSLNYVNFQRSSIIINLEHKQYHCLVSLRGYPQPCSGDALHCLWAEPCPVHLATSYAFRNFMIDRGLDLVVVDAQFPEFTADGIAMILPDYGQCLRTREAKRYSAKEVQVTLLQNSVSLSGVLDDFTATSFRVLVTEKHGETYGLIDGKAPVYAIFLDGNTVLYTGECRPIRQMESAGQRACVFEHLYTDHIGISQRILKSTGRVLIPQPGISFTHPLSKKRISLKSEEISSCWFSVIEDYDRSVLFSGLVIPEVEIELAPGLLVTCKARVSHGDTGVDKEEGTVKWWILVLDMGIEDQGRLFSLLQRTQRHSSHACNKVDQESLWQFFFDTGLVYAKKYAGIHVDREAIKETYKRLYLDSPTITRHFMQVDKGIILSHLAMLRFYENTWMLHHHAAVGQTAAGLSVLNQVRDYVHDYRHMGSSHMDFLVCYFRADNKFPSRVFGGFCLRLNNPDLCSMDSFAYLHFTFKNHQRKMVENNWRLETSTRDDLSELNNFYNYFSGGLMVKALDLGPEMGDADTLKDEYEKLGLKREKHLYSFKKDGSLKAVFMVLASNAGLNLSNLTNCIHVFLLDDEELSKDLLFQYLAELSKRYVEDEIPLLIFPPSYADNQCISYDLVYNLWAFDTRYTEKFSEYMQGIVPKKKNIDSAQTKGDGTSV